MDGTTKADRAEATEAMPATVADAVAPGLQVHLVVREPEIVEALSAHAEGRARDDFARTALRIGVLALNQAQSRVDADIVHREGEHLITLLAEKLGAHHDQLETVVAGTLSSYFNPQDGKFNERVERLIRQDGDLERLMRGQVDESIRSFKQTLEEYVGESSTLARLLAPNDSNELLAAIRNGVTALVAAQRDEIVSEFSLDNKNGALARLVGEVSARNGALTGDVKNSVQRIIDEFSLDKDGSALNRLVRHVEQTQKRISAEFTLDSDESALSRMRRDLLGMIDVLRKDGAEFQQNVIAALEAMKARKAESLASTRHGHEFEAAAFAFIEDIGQRAGDITERTGEKTGKIKHCKVGDSVITLGPDCDAASARIVFEMKEDTSFDLKKSLAELAIARANRSASVGVFVHSKRSAPAGLKPLARYGTDIVAVWDAEDEASDVYLSAAMMIAKALALRTKAVSQGSPVDVDALDRAVREIERQTGLLEEIRTSSGTIKSSAEKILARVEQMRAALSKQIAALDQQALALRELGQAAVPA